MRHKPAKIPKTRPLRRVDLIQLPLLGIATLTLLTTPALAAPTTMAVHGSLSTAAFGPVSDGVYDMTFALYAKKADTKAAWTEGPLPVGVKSGRFVHVLGSKTALSATVLTGLTEGWMGVAIQADPELPRTRLHNVAWAFVAQSAAALSCSGCVGKDQLGAASVGPQQAGFAYAGSTTKGGPADKALDLQCTGCVSVAELKFDSDVDLGGKALKAGKVTADSVVGKDIAATNMTATTLTATSIKAGELQGDGSKITGIKLPKGTCAAGQFVRGIDQDGKLLCAVAMDPANLPPDGLNEISNDLLTNQFVDSWKLEKEAPIDDNKPSGTAIPLLVGDVGLAQAITVTVGLKNSDTKSIQLLLTDPGGGKHVLYDKTAAGSALNQTWTDKSKLPSGSLAGWVGKNPKGTWTLTVVDSKYLNNKTDGAVSTFTISIQTLSSKKVLVNGELLFRYHVNEQHPVACDAKTVGFAYYNKKLDALLICTGSKWRAIGAPVGLQSNPGKSCKHIRDEEGNTAKSGTYYIDVPGNGVQPLWCDMETDGGGWTLVWKHSYREVGKVNADMTFFSSKLTACPDLKTGWCNVPNKTKLGATEQMVSATHKGTLVFAYKGKLNAQLDSAWQGAILSGYKKIVDLCASSNGSPPEPEAGGHAYKGITFDKTATGNYTSNCDTDRYGSTNTDCRWENCSLPGNISSSKNHVQQTYYMWVR